MMYLMGIVGLLILSTLAFIAAVTVPNTAFAFFMMALGVILVSISIAR